jgi:hypothetical protein
MGNSYKICVGNSERRNQLDIPTRIWKDNNEMKPKQGFRLRIETSGGML